MSNLVLGFVNDLRSHPIRFLLSKGIQISISPDCPCFLGYEGVTMDYVAAFLAWDLDLKDLKKLSMNGIKYSSIGDGEEKKRLVEVVFTEKWKLFIEYVIEKYNV